MDAQKSNANIDFLSKIPIEIWKEIIFSIPSHFAAERAESADPILLTSDFPIPYRIFKDMQQYKLNLLTVCKTLHPLAEELLYSKIGLRTTPPISPSFEKAVTGLSSGSKQRRRGEITTHLWVFIPGEVEEQLFQPSVLLALCPRLRFLSIDTKDENSVTISMDIKTNCVWSPSLTTLKLEYWQFKWEDLHNVAVSFPQLNMLVFCNTKQIGHWDSIPVEPITFPNLQYLRIEVDGAVGFPYHHLCLPSLHWVSLSFSDSSDTQLLDSLLQTISPTLVGFEVNMYQSSQVYPETYDLIFQHVPNLQTLVISIESQYHISARSLTPSCGLKHLMVNMVSEPEWYGDTLSDCLRPFRKRSVFFQLNEVTLVFPDAFSGAPLCKASTLLVRHVKKLFPHALVTGRNAGRFPAEAESDESDEDQDTGEDDDDDNDDDDDDDEDDEDDDEDSDDD